jgi:WD40 repeat protein
MKKRMFFNFTLLLVSTLFVSNTFAEDYTQWSLPNGAKTRIGKGSISDLQYSPDGTRLAVASSIGIWLYNAHTGGEIALLTGHTGVVNSVDYSPDGSTLVSGSADGTVSESDARQRASLCDSRIPIPLGWGVCQKCIVKGIHPKLTTQKGITNLMKKRMFFNFTLLLVSTLFVSNTFAEDYTQWSLPNGAKTRIGKGSISDLQYSPDGTRLAVASSIGIWLYNAHTGGEIALLTGHTGVVNSVDYSPDGSTLVSGSADGTVRLWDAVTGAPKRILTGHTFAVLSVVFSPDGNTLASGSGNEIRLWNAGVCGMLSQVPPSGLTGDQKQTLTGHTSAVLSVALVRFVYGMPQPGWRHTC